MTIVANKHWLKRWLDQVRQLTGDDAYDRYLQHHHQHHGDKPVLDRRTFYLAEQQRKWSGINRCC